MSTATAGIATLKLSKRSRGPRKTTYSFTMPTIASDSSKKSRKLTRRCSGNIAEG
jgi:hypothetical protein